MEKEVVIFFGQALNVVHPSIHCHELIMTPIDGGAEIRDFIAALETAPEVMAAAVGAVILGLVIVLLPLIAVTSGGVVILSFLLFGPPRPIILVVLVALDELPRVGRN